MASGACWLNMTGGAGAQRERQRGRSLLSSQSSHSTFVDISVYFIAAETFEGTVIGFSTALIKLTPKEPLLFIFFRLQRTVAIFTQLWQ